MEPPSAFMLAETPFLKGLEWRHLEAMSSCAMGVRFPAGERIFETGQPANRFYLLLGGRVALETPAESGPPIRIQVIEAGDVLGWSWLFPPYTWQFNARTLEPVEAVFFYGTKLRELAEEDPAFCCAMMKRMTHVILQRLQATRSRLAHLPPAP
jgi:CRP/FNR family cyclic AMP-dependent transcriptional regulator